MDEHYIPPVVQPHDIQNTCYIETPLDSSASMKSSGFSQALIPDFP